MEQVWCELKYGLKGQGVALCKLDNPYLLKIIKSCALQQALRNTEESNGVDEVIHLQDEMELERLERLLNLLIPEEVNDEKYY